MNSQTVNELKLLCEKLQSIIAELQTDTPDRTYSKEEVRQLLAKLAGSGHRDEVKALLTKYNAENLATLDPTHYAAIMADAEAIDHE